MALSDDELVALGSLLAPEARQYIEARLERLELTVTHAILSAQRSQNSKHASITGDIETIRSEVAKMMGLLGTPQSMTRLRFALELLAASDRGEIKLPDRG